MRSVLIGILIFVQCNAFASQAKTEFMQKLQGINTFKAMFEQIIRDEFGQVITKSSGTMLVKRPNMFYWQAEIPDRIQIIADGKILWSFDVELEQVTKQPLSQTLPNAPAAILAGDLSDFNKQFAVEYAEDKQCAKQQQCYKIKPLDNDSLFSDLLITMQGNKILALYMTDPMGQKVTTRFHGIQVNSTIDNAKFQFRIPKGVDVVEMGSNE